MSHTPPTNANDPFQPAPERVFAEESPLSPRDRLLARVVDGEATDEEWSCFRSLADGEFPGAERCTWRELAEAQRQQAILAGAVGAELSHAERIGLPRRRHSVDLRPESPAVIGRVGAWGGWVAAAAVIGLVAFSALLGETYRLRQDGGPQTGPTQTAGLYRINSPEDAVRAYLDKGRQTGQVLEELPTRVLIDSRPVGDGRFEVVYLRQFIERAEITDVHSLGRDESGAIIPVPVRAPAPAWEAY